VRRRAASSEVPLCLLDLQAQHQHLQPLNPLAFSEAQQRHALAGEALQPGIAVSARRASTGSVPSPVRCARFGKIIVIARSSEAPAIFFET